MADPNTQKDEFLGFLNQQVDKAKKYTEQFTKRNKRDVDLYEGKHVKALASVVENGDIVSQYNMAQDKRYEVVDRMIFTNTEGAKASMFDRPPDLVFKSRNASGDQKKQLIMGVYEYLKDKLNLMEFANQALHWFVLSGFTTACIDYVSKSYDAVAFDEDGQPMLDEFGETVTYKKYVYDDPVIYATDPQKTFFANGSKFSIDMKKVPYFVKEEMIDVDEIKATYKKKVQATSVDANSEDKKSANMAKIYFYYGRVPKKYKDKVESWDVGAEYYIVFTKQKMLYSKRKKRRQAKIAKWYSQPNSFFGFGFGFIGEPYQISKEQRRGQIGRSADYSAFPKLAIKNDGEEKTNPEDWKDPRENLVVTYSSERPDYIQSPGIGDSVLKDLEKTESDAQSSFGLLDISTGAQQSNTVDTATGQTLFADAAQKRIKYGKALFMSFYRECVIELFKQCQENWQEPKTITITNDDGETEEIPVSGKELADIDFDKDLDIDPEGITVNKDVIREQMIALYDKVKEDPLVDRRKVFADMLRKGFGVTNPERYLKEASPVEPGTVLTNPQTGEQFTVDESGTVMSQEAQDDMAKPTADGGQVATTQQGVQNGVGL